jgi:hypothetical protein
VRYEQVTDEDTASKPNAEIESISFCVLLVVDDFDQHNTELDVNMLLCCYNILSGYWISYPK